MSSTTIHHTNQQQSLTESDRVQQKLVGDAPSAQGTGKLGAPRAKRLPSVISDSTKNVLVGAAPADNHQLAPRKHNEPVKPSQSDIRKDYTKKDVKFPSSGTNLNPLVSDDNDDGDCPPIEHMYTYDDDPFPLKDDYRDIESEEDRLSTVMTAFVHGTRLSYRNDLASPAYFMPPIFSHTTTARTADVSPPDLPYLTDTITVPQQQDVFTSGWSSPITSPVHTPASPDTTMDDDDDDSTHLPSPTSNAASWDYQF